MKYMGSKARFAKELLPIILNGRKINQYYVEPFCGGLGTADQVKGNVICSDVNKYLIAMWNGLKHNIDRPMDISKDFYSDVRNDYNNQGNKYSDFLKGWVGFMGSANGRFFDGGYSGQSKTKIGTVRDYISEAIRNIDKQISLIHHIQFIHSSYDQLRIPIATYLIKTQSSILFLKASIIPPFGSGAEVNLMRDIKYLFLNTPRQMILRAYGRKKQRVR